MREYGPSQTLLSRRNWRSGRPVSAGRRQLRRSLPTHLIVEPHTAGRNAGGAGRPAGQSSGGRLIPDLLTGSLRLRRLMRMQRVGRDAADADRQGLWEPLHQATAAYRGTVTDVANDVKLGGGCGYRLRTVLATTRNAGGRRAELAGDLSQVEVAVLATARNPTAALHLARYLAAADRGLEHFQKHGFRTAHGDHWADRPELSLFAGSMLRPAIADTIKQFEQREGVLVSTVYNGCGILVGQMKGGQLPDAYFACDVEFMKQVSEVPDR